MRKEERFLERASSVPEQEDKPEVGAARGALCHNVTNGVSLTSKAASQLFSERSARETRHRRKKGAATVTRTSRPKPSRIRSEKRDRKKGQGSREGARLTALFTNPQTHRGHEGGGFSAPTVTEDETEKKKKKPGSIKIKQ